MECQSFRILDKHKLAFVVEDTHGNLFGVFIRTSINVTQQDLNDNPNGFHIDDEDAFIFSLRSNGRISSATKFPIDYINKTSAFIVHRDSSNVLFSCGSGGDISLCKQCIHHLSTCKHHLFESEKHQKVLVGIPSDEKFCVKGGRVIQLKEFIHSFTKLIVCVLTQKKPSF